MAMGYLSVATAVGVVTSALQAQKAMREELAQKQIAGARSAGSLAQLTGGDPQKFSELRDAAREVFALGGANDQTEANQIAFQLESGGALSERQFIARSAIIGGEEGVAGIVAKAGKLQRTMGVGETGGFKQILSKAVAAAGPVNEVDMAAILSATATASAGGMATKLGLTDEEVMAAVSTVAQQSKSADVAGTQVFSLLTSLTKHGFAEEHKGKNLNEMLQVIRDRGMTEPESLKYFGRKEAAIGFGALQGGTFQDRLSEVKGAEGGGAIMKLIDVAERDRELWGIQIRRQEEAMQEIAARELGIQENYANADYAQRNRGRRARGWPEIINAMGTWEEKLADSIFGPPSTEGQFNQTGEARADAILAELRAMNSNLRDATRKPPVTVSDQ